MPRAPSPSPTTPSTAPLTSGPATFKYAGLEPDPTTDGTQTYGHGLGGDTLAVGQGTTQRLTLTDRHGDVVGGFDPADQDLAALPDSRTFDPFGQPRAGAGTAYGIGYQGDWTDPATGQVNMGARWYDPSSATFDSRDSISWPAGAPSALTNVYAYGAGNPVNNSDPGGHSPFDPGKNLGNCYYQWTPPPPGDDSYGTYKLICPPKPGPKDPPNPPKPGGDDGKGGDGGKGGGKGGGGGHKPPPPKPKCDAKCQAEKKRQKDIAKTDRTKKVVKDYVTNNTIPTPGVQDPHCSGGNATCPGYTGKPSTITGDSGSFNDQQASTLARQQIVNQNGEISTPASAAGGNCVLCMGMALPMDVCAGGSCFAPPVSGDPTSDSGTNIDGGALGQALGWSVVAALGIAIEGGGAGLVGAGVMVCEGVITCLVGFPVGVVGGGLAVAAGEDVRSTATGKAADQWSRVLNNESNQSSTPAKPTGQVGYGDTDLSKAVQQQRLKDKNKRNNYAAARLDDGTILVGKSSAGVHAEEDLIAQANGRKIDDLYSELEPCANKCATKTSDMNVTYSWRWNGVDRPTSKADMKKAIDDLFANR